MEALLFVTCVLLAYWSVKTDRPVVLRRWRRIVDTLVLVGLTLMGAICAIIALVIV